MRVGCVVATCSADGEGEDIEDVQALELVPALIGVWVSRGSLGVVWVGVWIACWGRRGYEEGCGV